MLTPTAGLRVSGELRSLVFRPRLWLHLVPVRILPLLAYELGAPSSWGTHSSMIDFLEKEGREWPALFWSGSRWVRYWWMPGASVSSIRPGPAAATCRRYWWLALPLAVLLMLSSPVRQVPRLILLQVRLAWRW